MALRPPSQTFLERLKKAREFRGMSQRTVVARLEDEHNISISQPAYALLEQGKRKLSFDEAVALAAVVDAPLNQLYAPSWEDYLVMESEAGR